MRSGAVLPPCDVGASQKMGMSLRRCAHTVIVTFVAVWGFNSCRSRTKWVAAFRILLLTLRFRGKIALWESCTFRQEIL